MTEARAENQTTAAGAGTLVRYQHLPKEFHEHFAKIEDFICDLDGKTLCTATGDNTFLDEGVVVADDWVEVFNSLVALIAARIAAVPDGWKLVPSKATAAWATAIAESIQGQSSTPKCEPPTSWDIERAFRSIETVLAAAPEPTP